MEIKLYEKDLVLPKSYNNLDIVVVSFVIVVRMSVGALDAQKVCKVKSSCLKPPKSNTKNCLCKKQRLILIH